MRNTTQPTRARETQRPPPPPRLAARAATALALCLLPGCNARFSTRTVLEKGPSYGVPLDEDLEEELAAMLGSALRHCGKGSEIDDCHHNTGSWRRFGTPKGFKKQRLIESCQLGDRAQVVSVAFFSDDYAVSVGSFTRRDDDTWRLDEARTISMLRDRFRQCEEFSDHE